MSNLQPDIIRSETGHQPMNSTVLCSEAEITRMVHEFYGRVRKDEQLGPIFNQHIDDWDHHLEHLSNFWSSLLLRTGRFSGTPMQKHVVLSGLTAELFQQWLKLFRETARAQPNQAMDEQAIEMAQRIAQSLWYGYQLTHHPDVTPVDVYS